MSLISHLNSSNIVGPGEEVEDLRVSEPLLISIHSGDTEVPCAHGDGGGVSDCTVLDSLAQGDDGGAGDL